MLLIQYGNSKAQTPLLESIYLIPSANEFKSFKCWNTFVEVTTSTFSVILCATSRLKNLVSVGIHLSIDNLDKFSDGSMFNNQRFLSVWDSNVFNKVPSFPPMSINLEFSSSDI